MYSYQFQQITNLTRSISKHDNIIKISNVSRLYQMLINVIQIAINVFILNNEIVC